MKLKEVSQLIFGMVNLYEDSGDECFYKDIFAGERRDIPEEILEREIVVIGASPRGEMLDIELKKK